MTPQNQQPIRQVVLASFIGTTIEWYDFFIYGTAAALIFNELFFPTFSDVAGKLAAFAVFGAGFVVRPLGGIVFGHFGDRLGRKSMLVLSLFIMGAATFLIGLLPTYDSFGVLAPVLLVVLRLLQGFAVGGEWGGAVLMAVEHSPKERRGYHGSWPQSGAPAGLVLASAAFALVSLLPKEQFMTWGWRVPFLCSVALLLVGLVIRLRLAETPDFERVKQSGRQVRLPVIEAIRRHPKNLLLAFGACIAPFLQFYLFGTYILTYATTELKIERGTVLLIVSIAAALEVITIPAFAALSDRIGRRKVFLAGTVAYVLYAYPFFLLIDSGSPLVLAVATIIGLSVIHPAMYGPLAALFADMFSARVRYSGASLGYQIGGMLGGGFAPVILTSLQAAAGSAVLGIPPYMIAAGLITIVATYLATRAATAEEARAVEV
ncbi:metabolite-proton symporter [Nonomuraea thailandensis]|uniref:Putative proline/betaine transporter n=1 Tax=Nonomuraea thailandensis TaxID=1188745 RepID=A0A9X2K7D0_9ACTN|nr:MFS transporter [Nonomuraea thailandensis]MCP2362440.1 metabolite-proton symporter [Nonomuraea thailandensis]